MKLDFFILLLFSLLTSSLWGQEKTPDFLADLKLPDEQGIDDKFITFFESTQEKQSVHDSELEAARIRTLAAKFVGQDRLLIKVTFDRPLVTQSSRFRLYLDLDGNRETGRKDAGATGVDLMFFADESGGHQDFPADNDLQLNGRNTAARYVCDKNTLYITIQTQFPEGGLLPVRMFFLSERQTESGSTRSTTPQNVSRTLNRPETQAVSLLNN